MATVAEAPNILFVLADDLGWSDVGYHGGPIRTPHIDRLASTGVELDQHYVYPVCTPTRASLLTGRFASRFGEHATVPTNLPVLPDGYETLASTLHGFGYDTGLFGKWHLGSALEHGPNEYGFAASYGSLGGGVDPWNHRYKTGPFSRTWHRDREFVDEPGHVTDLITREAAAWIESRERPWFCYVPFTAVHIPIDAPASWLATYDGRSYDSDPRRDRSFKRYAAYVSHMDDAVGRLIETLDRTGQRERTLVVFTSDNGAPTGYPRSFSDEYPGRHWDTPRLGSNLPLRGEKADLYEGGVRTPAVVSWPGVLGPGVTAAPVFVADWMPTLLALVGAEPRHNPAWDGLDVWTTLASGVPPLRRRDIYWNYREARFALRRDGWKVVQDTEAGTVELYDIDADPREEHDLAAAHPHVARELLSQVEAHRRLDGSARRRDVPGTPEVTGTGAPT